MAEHQLDRSFWEQRWMTARLATDGASLPPNHTMTDTATALPVGTALDAGCGEAADALWLADRGWRVTAVDFVASVLQRGRSRAEELGPDVSARIQWQEADLSAWTPPVASFDLVTSHYMHGIANRESVFRRLADAVRPGGTLLVVGHHPSNADNSGEAMSAAVFFTTADLIAVLGDDWVLVTVDDDVPRRTLNHDGQDVTVRAAMVRARRV
jgi:SAM-dependent methyltransferase